MRLSGQMRFRILLWFAIIGFILGFGAELGLLDFEGHRFLPPRSSLGGSP